jgi:hypothetical protein
VPSEAISLKLAFSAYQARTNLRDEFLAGCHLLYYFQEVSIRKMLPGKGDGVCGHPMWFGGATPSWMPRVRSRFWEWDRKERAKSSVKEPV